ncbi:MAG TPA: FtsX-like permease family protein, partial [Candidatus Acidoferrum sp.]|nr:FtsX-like permease family protein [Candidatus Acidoferrum sp.]
MGKLKLFYRLIARPLFREPVRTGLTVFAVAIGVAVVLAIELAGNAAAGSFHSSMETLARDYTLEIVAVGGVPDSVVAMIAQQPLPIRYSVRMEDFATVAETKETLPLIGLDMIAEGSRYLVANGTNSEATTTGKSAENELARLEGPTSVWVGSSLKKEPGAPIELIINDLELHCIVQGVYPDSNGNESAIVMDLSGAEHALNRKGHVDRILLKIPENTNAEEWQQKIAAELPSGVTLRPQGTGTAENRKMLAAFRWNLRLLSYIALVVGAFLIYNTISISVVRRRAEIGIIRALGASRRMVFLAFLGEAAGIGLAGALIGLVLGRFLASGAVKLMALTVDKLYVSSRPGAISLDASIILLALFIGIAVSVVSALGPAREAISVSPVDAMARGRRDYATRLNTRRDLLIALILATAAFALSQLPAVAGKPLFGYLATLLLIGAAAYAIPFLVNFLSRISMGQLRRILGVEGFLAARSLVGSLGRTSVLVGALATAVGMMTSVGIMVGSFRQTVVSWMEHQLPADLYLRPAGDPAANRHPTMSLELADKIAALPGVAAVDRLREYEISYDGMPVTLASVDIDASASSDQNTFFSGRPAEQVLSKIRGTNLILVSEPFTFKHHAKLGDWIELGLGQSRGRFQISDVYYDYASERGVIVMDRNTMLKYLPDPTPSGVAVFVKKGTNPEDVRQEILNLSAGYRILISTDRDLRTEAVRIFDRTFAITYALEAVAVLVAIMGIAGALLALVIDRRRELGLLRFIGASSGQIRKIILAEAGLLGLMANFAGFLLGYFLSLILIFVINKQS